MGAHWERNILLNEMMTASEITNARISEFTLALMEDSGWYYTNFDFKEHFTHWKNVGCLLNFDLDLERMSLDGIKIDQLYYANNECQVKHSKGCYYDFTHQALCYKDEFMGNPNDERYAQLIPSKYRYFGQASDSCVNPLNSKNSDIFGEKHESSSRCFTGNFRRSGLFKTKPLKFQSTGSFCFSSKCIKDAPSSSSSIATPVKPTQIEILIEGKPFYCSYAGEILQIEVKVKNPLDKKIPEHLIQGSITCPDPDQFCLHEPKCREDCELIGRCLAKGGCYKFD